jgi:uncharacterized protein YfaS (alpha-2-macroglobulin family)
MGDTQRGAAAFDLAEKNLSVWDIQPWWAQGDFYRSSLRDTAEMVALAAEMNDDSRLLRLLDRLDHSETRVEEMNTQQQAWLAVAAATLIKRTGRLDVTIGDQNYQAAGMINLLRDLASIGKGIDLRNNADHPVLRSIAVRGLPLAAPPAASNGLTLTKTITTLTGTPVDLAHLKQNSRLMVHLSGTMTDNTYHQAMLVDLLPSGFEIEKIVPRSTTDEPNGFAFLGDITPTRMAQKQDDRLLAAIDLDNRPIYDGDTSNADHFNMAYIVRVVTPGQFILPAAAIRDMYRADVTARTAPGTITVEAPP